MPVFNDIRQVVTDPSEEGQRRRANLAHTAGMVKGISGLGMLAFGGLTTISILSIINFPLIGGFFALLGSVGTIGAHEVKILSENTESMVAGRGVLGNVFNRTSAVWSTKNFTTSITKGTWIVGPYFGTSIERGLRI